MPPAFIHSFTHSLFVAICPIINWPLPVHTWIGPVLLAFRWYTNCRYSAAVTPCVVFFGRLTRCSSYIFGRTERMRYGVLRPMVSSVCQVYVSRGFTQFSSVNTAKRIEIPLKGGDFWEPKEVCVRRKSRFPHWFDAAFAKLLWLLVVILVLLFKVIMTWSKVCTVNAEVLPAHSTAITTLGGSRLQRGVGL